MNRRALAAGALVTATATVLVSLAVPAGASPSPANQGVTAKTISVGLPYVNFAALRSLGITTNQGNFPDAYDAIAAYMNAHGGVDGRKIVIHSVAMNPAVPTDAASVCTQLTEDDDVFVAIAPVFPDCYQQDHDTPVISGSLPGALPKSAPPDFTLSPPDTALDPVQLAAFAKMGALKGKKVGVFYASDTDKPEVGVVQSDLKKMHVDVVLTAEDSAPSSDAVATDQDIETIAQRFQDSGVNEVVAVGGAASTAWPKALLDNQSDYKPPWIATDESALLSYVTSAKGANPYLDNVLASQSGESNYQEWSNPAMQQCVATVKKAYPSDAIAPPANPASPGAGSASQTGVSVEEACQLLALFAKIADGAGKNLTVASFTKAGYGLKNVTLPGVAAPVSFGPGQQYAIVPVQVVKYSPTSQTLLPVPAAK